MTEKSFELYEAIISTQEIICDKCGENNVVQNMDDLEACDYFYEQGWRGVGDNGECICPDCIKKKTKKKFKNQNK